MIRLKIKGFLASLLAAALLTCSASAMEFPDVDSSSDYAAAVEYVSELKIMVGDNAGNFNPDKIVSRAEMATIVCRVLSQTENLTKSYVFTDVPTTHWANGCIGKASELGIVGGYGGGKFAPSDPVTFEQAVTMIVRAIGDEGKANFYGGYPDGFLKVAQEKNLLSGIKEVTGQGLSRGSVAILLYNYYAAKNNSAATNDGHIHSYIEMTIPSGHYEQVQVGTEEVIVGHEKDHLVYQCTNCRQIFDDHDSYGKHAFENLGHGGSLVWWEGPPIYETRPVYEKKWVADPPKTIRICEICGQKEP